MIGIASPAFCFSPFEDALDEISEHFGLWEVLLEGEHRLEIVQKKMLDAIGSYDVRFQIHAPMSDVNIGSVYEPMRRFAVREIEAAIRACNEMEIDLITLHPGFIGGIAFLDKSIVIRQTKRSLAHLAHVAIENSVELAIENMPQGINATCTTAEELMSVVGEAALGICFDMGHANTSGQIEPLLRHSASFRNVHLHNNDGSWDQHNPIGEGTADVRAVVSAIRESGYGGNYIIESTDLAGGIASRKLLDSLLEQPPTPKA